MEEVSDVVTVLPRRRFGRILNDLGGTLLDVACGVPDPGVDIGEVAIHDPLDDPAHLSHHAVVLGIGVTEPTDVADLLLRLGHKDAVALVVRAPVLVESLVLDAASRSGVTLLTLTRGASWTHLADLMRAILSDHPITDPESEAAFGTAPTGDLFAVANAVAALLDAPVTIEDRESRVLAFSERQGEADRSRVETILGRQVPEPYTRMLEERGVFRRLYREDGPVYVEPLQLGADEISLPRVALAVRAGDDVLGSIWVAVRSPLSAERTQALADAAKVVALHLLQLRAGADVQRRLRTDLVSTALEGGIGSPYAMRRLGLLDQPVTVLAVAQLDTADRWPSPGSNVRRVAGQQRLSDALAMQLGAMQPRSAVALLGDTVYGIVPASGSVPDAQDYARRAAGSFLDCTGRRLPVVIGVGPTAYDAQGLARSRAGADRAVRVLRNSGSPGRVAALSEVWSEALLLELSDLVAANGDVPAGPIARLCAYDDQHQTQLLPTLQAWLDAFGNVVAAAESLYIHPNTFRYRLRRVAEVGHLELDDPDERFAAMLELRLMTSGDRSGNKVGPKELRLSS
ncbi:MAG: hypothetical protein QOD35_2113 [Nocardioidaceae bacterium]|nr:hypothetical protein [Nocardioidaceae bacterium]